MAWGVPLSRANRPDGSRLSRSRAHHAGQPGCQPPPRGCFRGQPGPAGPGPLTSRDPEPEGTDSNPTTQRHVRRSLLPSQGSRAVPGARAPPLAPSRPAPLTGTRPRPAPLTGTRPARSRAVAARPGEGGSLP